MSSSRLHSLHRSLVLRGRASGMREQATASERVLWEQLRVRKLGPWFRRQVVIEGSIVDFFAPSPRLVIEVDGAYHEAPSRKRADARRQRKLERAGLRVIRLPAALVLGDLREAVKAVMEALER